MTDQEKIRLPKKVAIVYSDVKREYFKTEEEYVSEEGADIYANDIAKYALNMGIDVVCLPCDESIAANLKKYNPSMILNLVDSVRGESTLGASVIGLYEILNIPYTGSGTLGWSIGTNKYLMYKLLESGGVPVPNHQLFTSHTESIDHNLRYPLFPKLNHEHSSIGVDEDSICRNEKQLRNKLKYLIDKFRQPILVDEFIAGIEVTASVLDGSNTKVYCVQRKTNNDTEGDVVTFNKKWKNWKTIEYIKYEQDNLKEYVRKTFDILKMSDYARIDLRIDASGRIYVIDPNCNPFFGPTKETHATYSIILDMYGVDFTETLKRIFINTIDDAKNNDQTI
ncbi:MAG: ATP-grasp domain-containing protein [bacterium]|nr:MAG: ATP-grasp domain-containing protein [bacterium]